MATETESAAGRPSDSDLTLERTPRTMIRDPVCGTEVDPSGAAFRGDYRGVPYFFCSLTCKRQFDDNPPQYVG
jgi:YHS domain-containing protein